MFYVILGVFLWLVLALWPAVMARRKGYSFVLFFLTAVFISWLVTLIVVALLKDKTMTAADRAAEAAAEKAVEAGE